MASENVIGLRLRLGNALKAKVDVLALKYAQHFYGVDSAAQQALAGAGVSISELKVRVGEHALVGTSGSLGAKTALFVGVPRLHEFQYEEIRHFSTQVLTILARRAPDVQTIAMTIHGVSYGLDAEECAQQQLMGVDDALVAGSYPANLKRIELVELGRSRFEMLGDVLKQHFSSRPVPPGWRSRSRMEWPLGPVPKPTRSRASSTRAIRSTVAQIAKSPAKKRSVFVAMPVDKRMRDIWRFGIRTPVRSAGLLCERMDEAHFTGEILKMIWKGIEEADLVIADLTGTNPNVFLEVGYAWGIERPTLLLCRKRADGDEPKLPFDVAIHKCLYYEDATDLEEQLGKELRGLGISSS